MSTEGDHSDADGRVQDFARQHPPAVLELARHAALPVALDPGLVHLLRTNFFLDHPKGSLPATAEADLLLSNLCHEVGDGLFEVDPAVRDLLLKELPHERLHEVATLLWQYTTRRAPWLDHPMLERAQQLTALIVLDPDRARRWLDEAEARPGPVGTEQREWFVAMRREMDLLAPGHRAAAVTNSLGMALVWIPAGEFLMGSPDSDVKAYDDEKPQHHVRISQPFYLGQYPVTQDQYKKVMGNNPSYFKGDGRLPVETVSWFDVIAFCNTLSKREELALYYEISGQKVTILGGSGYRLPTEAEWEYSCRAGSTTRYYFGDEVSKLDDFAWYSNNSELITHPVGQKAPNVWGLYDMLGSVWEWCWDEFDADYYRQSPGVDPAGPLHHSAPVFRGGSWNDVPRLVRSANRNANAPVNRGSNLGFRVSRALSGQ